MIKTFNNCVIFKADVWAINQPFLNYCFSLEEAMDYLLNNPVSPPPSLRQATGSNPEPLPPAGTQVMPSSSLAPGFSLTSKPSNSDSEQDELMRAIALSFAENITEAASASDSISESNVVTLMDMGFRRERCIKALKANLR